ncbi:MAG: DUF134 domain-containing protein [Bacteroidota bacterium]
MPRRKRMRRISQLPGHHGFRAVRGRQNAGKEQSPVILHLEEYEAIKLMDYELMNQTDAAGYMDVSRPTLTRIYESARRKMAMALVEGLSLRISGGEYELSEMWHKCLACGSQFSASANKSCPWCGARETELIKKEDNI